MTTEEIVDAARNAGFSSSEITRRIAAFKRLIQYSTSAEREKCTGTQEFVTLPSEVVEQALEALFEADSVRGDYQNVKVRRNSIAALRAALEQPQNHVPDAGNMVPVGWKLVPVVPTDDMLYDIQEFSHILPPRGKRIWAHMLAAAPQPPTVKECLTVEQPQGEQLAMTPIAQRKLDSLLTEGYTISGYSVYHEQKHQHGFATGAGLVGWWRPEGMEYPQPLGEQEPLFWYRPRGDGLYEGPLHKSQIERVREESGGWVPLYTNQQPKREPLTDEQIDAIADAMPGGLEGFMKGWGWRQFARAILEATNNIK